jgi:hypothetical protein
MVPSEEADMTGLMFVRVREGYGHGKDDGGCASVIHIHEKASKRG